MNAGIQETFWFFRRDKGSLKPHKMDKDWYCKSNIWNIYLKNILSY